MASQAVYRFYRKSFLRCNCFPVSGTGQFSCYEFLYYLVSKQTLRLYMLFLSLLPICFNSEAQKYSSSIKDSSVINFMSWYFKNDTALRVRRVIDINILKLNPENFKFPDSATLRDYRFAQNIFQPTNQLQKYFSSNDAAFFVQQVKRIRSKKWNLNLAEVELYDKLNAGKSPTIKSFYAYSLPVFSINKNYVIIIESHYCGLACGGGEYILFKREEGNSWQAIRRFNKWEQ